MVPLQLRSGTTSSRLLATVYTIPLEFPSNRYTENNGKDPDSVTYRMITGPFSPSVMIQDPASFHHHDFSLITAET